MNNKLIEKMGRTKADTTSALTHSIQIDNSLDICIISNDVSIHTIKNCFIHFPSHPIFINHCHKTNHYYQREDG